MVDRLFLARWNPAFQGDSSGLGPIGAAIRDMQDMFGARLNAEVIRGTADDPKDTAAIQFRARWQEDAFDPAKAK